MGLQFSLEICSAWIKQSGQAEMRNDGDGIT